MKREPVTSSSIESVGYDPAAKRMEIKFKRGGTYSYEGVSPEEHQALVSAKSIGAHFIKDFRPQHPSKKL